VALARALIRKPSILVLDEPGTGLDAQALAAIGQTLRVGRAGRTTFIVAHDPACVAIADRVLVLSQGRIVWSGAPAGLSRAGPPVESGSLNPAGNVAVDAIPAPFRVRPSRSGPQPCSTP
jgi:ABC-type bacteriocin/lantibiotic exporter with double-glycine peptidase domain